MCLCKLRHRQKLVRFRVKTSLFSYYFEMWPPLWKVIIMEMKWKFLWIQSMINRSQNYLQKSKFQSKVKSDSAMSVSCNFCYPCFLPWSISSPPVDVQLKRVKPLCWAYPRLTFLRVNWWQNIEGKRCQLAHCKFNDVN